MLSGSGKELERFESAYQARTAIASSPFDRLPLLLHVAVLVPLVVGLALVVAVLLAQEPQVRGSLNVLHLQGDSIDLWLSFSGAYMRADRSELIARRMRQQVRNRRLQNREWRSGGVRALTVQSPAAAFYESVEDALGLSSRSGLAAAIPPNLGASSLLLVLSAVCAGLAIALQTWGSADFQCAT